MNRHWLRATAIATAAFAGLYAAAHMLAPAPRLVWNASASEPLGLYRIDVGAEPMVGDFVLVGPPEAVAALLAERGYLPRGVPLLKRVAAGEGALVCRSGVFVTVDGRFAARARPADRLGRALPRWLGCLRLARGEFLLLGSAPDSFDSRYFGPLRAESLIGTAHPLLTRDAPGAPLRWRGGASDCPTTPQKRKPTS